MHRLPEKIALTVFVAAASVTTVWVSCRFQWPDKTRRKAALRLEPRVAAGVDAVVGAAGAARSRRLPNP